MNVESSKWVSKRKNIREEKFWKNDNQTIDPSFACDGNYGELGLCCSVELSSQGKF